jgi:hypothetical protein
MSSLLQMTCEMKTLDTKSHCICFIKHWQKISSVSRGIIFSSVNKFILSVQIHHFLQNQNIIKFWMSN